MTPKEKVSLLTNKQKEVLRHVCFGKTNGCIAIEMKLSIKTIEKHRQRAYDILGVSNNIDALRYALKGSVVSLEEWLAVQPVHSVHGKKYFKTPDCNHEPLKSL